jgi:hypothetical protein
MRFGKISLVHILFCGKENSPADRPKRAGKRRFYGGTTWSSENPGR